MPHTDLGALPGVLAPSWHWVRPKHNANCNRLSGKDRGHRMVLVPSYSSVSMGLSDRCIGFPLLSSADHQHIQCLEATECKESKHAARHVGCGVVLGHALRLPYWWCPGWLLQCY